MLLESYPHSGQFVPDLQCPLNHDDWNTRSLASLCWVFRCPRTCRHGRATRSWCSSVFSCHFSMQCQYRHDTLSLQPYAFFSVSRRPNLHASLSTPLLQAKCEPVSIAFTQKTSLSHPDPNLLLMTVQPQLPSLLSQQLPDLSSLVSLLAISDPIS